MWIKGNRRRHRAKASRRDRSSQARNWQADHHPCIATGKPAYLNHRHLRSIKLCSTKSHARSRSGTRITSSRLKDRLNSRKTMIMCRRRAPPLSSSRVVTKTVTTRSGGPNTHFPRLCKTCLKRFKRRMTQSNANQRLTQLETLGHSWIEDARAAVTSAWHWSRHRWRKNRKNPNTIILAFRSMGDLVLQIPQKHRLMKATCLHRRSEEPPSG